VVAQGGFNRTAVLVHALAIAAGLLAGWFVMDRITPDFPTDDPGVESSSAPAAVSGDDPDSLFRSENLLGALYQLDDQTAAGEGVVRLHITPGSIDMQTGDAAGAIDLDEVHFATPSIMVEDIRGEHPQVTLADVQYIDLVATADGPRWFIQLDRSHSGAGPPWTYSAPLIGYPVRPGGPPPEPIEG
jgi:hypothetical protein